MKIVKRIQDVKKLSRISKEMMKIGSKLCPKCQHEAFAISTKWKGEKTGQKMSEVICEDCKEKVMSRFMELQEE